VISELTLAAQDRGAQAGLTGGNHEDSSDAVA
jgi:hypothetical protein